VTNQATLNVTTWYRNSTREWVGEIDLVTRDTSGTFRFTGATENEARDAAFAAIGGILLETTFNA